jgi:hypothetical protein
MGTWRTDTHTGRHTHVKKKAEMTGILLQVKEDQRLPENHRSQVTASKRFSLTVLRRS